MTFREIIKTCVIFIFVTLSSTHSIAETLFDCEYDHYSSDDLRVEKAKNFNLLFLVRDDGSASMIGNLGAEPLKIRTPSDDAINFIETTDTGNLMLTTIDSELKSVHSRHTVMYGELVPTQYYGQCTVR